MVNRKSNLKTNRRLITRRRKPQKGGKWYNLGSKIKETKAKNLFKPGKSGRWTLDRFKKRRHYTFEDVGGVKSKLKVKGNKLKFVFGKGKNKQAFKFKIDKKSDKYKEFQDKLKNAQSDSHRDKIMQDFRKDIQEGKHADLGLIKKAHVKYGSRKWGVPGVSRRKTHVTTFRQADNGSNIIHKVTDTKGKMKTTAKHVYNKDGTLKKIKKTYKDKSKWGSSLGRGTRTERQRFEDGHLVKTSRTRGYGKWGTQKHIKTEYVRDKKGKIMLGEDDKPMIVGRKQYKGYSWTGTKMTEQGYQDAKKEQKRILEQYDIKNSKLVKGKFSDDTRSKLEEGIRKGNPTITDKELKAEIKQLEKQQKTINSFSKSHLENKSISRVARGNETKLGNLKESSKGAKEQVKTLEDKRKAKEKLDKDYQKAVDAGDTEKAAGIKKNMETEDKKYYNDITANKYHKGTDKKKVADATKPAGDGGKPPMGDGASSPPSLDGSSPGTSPSVRVSEV